MRRRSGGDVRYRGTVMLLALLVGMAARSLALAPTTPYRQAYLIVNNGGGRSTSSAYKVRDRVEVFCSSVANQTSVKYSVKDLFLVTPAKTNAKNWKLYQ